METDEEKQERTPWRQALITIGLSLTLTGLIVASYIVADLISTPLSIASPAFLYITSGLAVLVGGSFLATVVMLIFLGVREGNGLLRTAFYRPQVLKHTCLLAITGPAGLRGLDRIIHHTHLTWSFLIDPEVVVLASIYYFGVLITSLWFTGSWVVTSGSNHRATWRRVVVGCAAFNLLLVVLMVAGYWLGGKP